MIRGERKRTEKKLTSAFVTALRQLNLRSSIVLGSLLRSDLHPTKSPGTPGQ